MADAEAMSAWGQKQTCVAQKSMSASPESGHSRASSKCPLSAKADIDGTQLTISTSRARTS